MDRRVGRKKAGEAQVQFCLHDGGTCGEHGAVAAAEDRDGWGSFCKASWTPAET